jgi:rSAM/selenodomain-associated transferase 2
VVIPTLDEQRHLNGCLDALQGQQGVIEILVVDGGSTDGTQASARRAEVAWLTAPRGRGIQIAAGVAAAVGDVILVLHADCRPSPDLCRLILEGLTRDPGAVGGAASMAFAGGKRSRRLIAGLNNLRARLTGISFGDQCQFLRREALPGMGGFPAQPLMEDVELSLRLKERGRLLFLPSPVRVSGRRWESRPFLSNAAQVVGLCLSYLLQRRFRVDPGWIGAFYRRYYGSKDP